MRKVVGLDISLQKTVTARSCGRARLIANPVRSSKSFNSGGIRSTWFAPATAATPAFECFQFCACRTSVQAEPSFKRFSERDCVPAFFLGKKD
jgi:hypothetical protein